MVVQRRTFPSWEKNVFVKTEMGKIKLADETRVPDESLLGCVCKEMVASIVCFDFESAPKVWCRGHVEGVVDARSLAELMTTEVGKDHV